MIAAALVAGPLISLSFWQSNVNSRIEATSLAGTNNTLQGLPQPGLPTILDGSLRVEKVVSGLQMPTSMKFSDHDKIVILEKNGAVRLVSNGVLQPNPIFNVVVRNDSERGLLGIAIANSDRSTEKTVFLYYTEPVGDQTKNRIYRYEWDGSGSFTNGKLILDLPGEPGPNHDGGKLVIGPDGMLYAVKGDLNRRGMLQNHKDGSPPDDTSVILRTNLDGSPAQGNPFLDASRTDSSYANLSKYYAYGIRNSFGLAFDPRTGTLWDVEDGPTEYDEMNVVTPGFNSGWARVMGPLERQFIEGKSINDLVQFPGSHYANPVFSSNQSIGITDIAFLNSTKLGEKYAYNIFVGDVNNGSLFFFKVNSNRTGLDFGSAAGLQDLVADNSVELNAITIGTGFGGGTRGGITDIQTGPDGYLYILTFAGDLYRIVPAAASATAATDDVAE
ncbi:MAG TPA: PQQ-dependent sugar dehydrogenase [Nitrososphaera sp.]|nr:PQQ-dependent sugar dehydrogenase [Nitrososphaera sp.]